MTLFTVVFRETVAFQTWGQISGDRVVTPQGSTIRQAHKGKELGGLGMLEERLDHLAVPRGDRTCAHQTREGDQAREAMRLEPLIVEVTITATVMVTLTLTVKVKGSSMMNLIVNHSHQRLGDIRLSRRCYMVRREIISCGLGCKFIQRAVPQETVHGGESRLVASLVVVFPQCTEESELQQSSSNVADEMTCDNAV